jgi:hypothetical protein
MKLDKNHLHQFEDISPPMKNALTLPVLAFNGRETGVIVYVCGSTFGKQVGMKQIQQVAQSLQLGATTELEKAIHMVASSPLLTALAQAQAALRGESNDDEHDALLAIVQAVGLPSPEEDER